MRPKIGCGKHVQVGYNKILDCPINFQCGMSQEGNELMLCSRCKKSPSNVQTSKEN